MLQYLFQRIPSLWFHNQNVSYQILAICQNQKPKKNQRKYPVISSSLRAPTYDILIDIDCDSPCDMKNGILNLPETTILRRSCNVAPSNGNAPHTSTYNTTPKLQMSARGPSYSSPRNTWQKNQNRMNYQMEQPERQSTLIYSLLVLHTAVNHTTFVNVNSV